ncbi:hypothetical protein KVR01_007671 [Diaporthe batatas]|uniref:uncharacterized protein n=1 Tax=Diaporthe batatas TaxID=748121 RepID=UPI001D046E5D|nr:uncharacterized protein KVR01_007671 [Diaporthe batatas]KAG8161906.1 hypothetical protein KVR01_007671 [Diaporthe batatas]
MAAATTHKSDEHVVAFKFKPEQDGPPYNHFTVKADGKKGEMTLVDRNSLGLNKAWLTRPEGVTKAQTNGYPFWGSRIYEEIQNFNKKPSKKRRVLFYDIRHGEADHNRWKNLMPDKWAEPSEYRKRPTFEYGGKEYCIIDPPLTGKGSKDAEGVKELFKKLKSHGYPMPNVVLIGPSRRTRDTFKLGLKGDDLGIDIQKCWVVPCLREQETGNCADILINEFLAGQKIPPPAGSGKVLDWMEVEDKATGENPRLKRRVEKFFEDLPKFDESDCVARVTHSLLNQHTLKSLEVGQGRDKIKVMDKFMLDEGGCFAYVFELDRADESARGTIKPSPEWTRYLEYEKAMGPGRATAFPLTEKASYTVPPPVGIGPGIRPPRVIPHKNDVEPQNITGNNQTVKSKKKDDGEKVTGFRGKAVIDKNAEDGNHVGNRKIVDSRSNTGNRGKNVKRAMPVERQKNDPRSTRQGSG